MANLLGQNIGTNYKGILNLNTLNGNLSGTLQAVTDGDGNASPLTLSTGEVGISRTIALSAGSSNVRLINETYTINNSGAQTGTATGIFLNATETALNGMGHDLLDLQRGGVSQFNVRRDGQTTINGEILGNSNIRVGSGWALYWSGAGQIISIGASASVFLITDASQANFGRLQLGGTTNAFPAIKRNGAGIDFRLADDSGFAAISAAQVTSNGNVGIGTFNALVWAERSIIGSPSDGTLSLYNQALTDFSRLQFGGTTNAFPAIKRSGAGIDFRLADDSGFCDISSSKVNSPVFNSSTTIDFYAASYFTLRPSGGGTEAFVSAGYTSFGGVGSNSGSCVFELLSTTKGFLPPRMTTTQRDLIGTPAAGLMIYNTTTNRPNFYDGSAWVAL
jgi:hypothetical protein